MKRAVAALLALAFGVAAHAAPPNVWRCGNVYADAPCTGGRQVAMADTTVSAADAAQARRQAMDLRREADAMERERLLREARPKPLAVSIGPVRPVVEPAKTTRKTARKKGGKDARGVAGDGREGDFTVDLPRPKKGEGSKSGGR